jgi:hypothetical protein
MSNLYQEALADAKSLRELAEKNARNRIIESISPQIRKMIEKQMLSEADDEVPEVDEAEDVPNLDLDPLPDDAMAGDMGAAPNMMPPAMPGANPNASDAGEEVNQTVTTKTASGTEVKINVKVDKRGEAAATASADVADGDDVDVDLNEESLRSLSDLIFGQKAKPKQRASLGVIRRQMESLNKISRGLPLNERNNFRAAYAIMIKNVGNFRNHLISNGIGSETKKKFNSIVKEIKVMSSSARFRRLLEEMESKKALRNEAKLVFEPADLEGLNDEDFKAKLQGMTFGVEFDEGDEAGGDTPVDVADTGAGAPSAPPAPPAPAAPPMAEDDDEELDEMYDEDEEDEGMSLDEEDEELDENDTVFNVNESMLRKELRRIKESKKGIKNAMADQFGGGKEDGDPWLDGEVTTEGAEEDGETLDEVEAEQIAEKALKVAKKATSVAQNERESRIKEARINRGLKGKLDESQKMIAALREQLEDVNLFNAKLLYVNKLMQNRDLTPRQQRSIVESLDRTQSVSEAKLLYNSLTESLKVKTGNINEGRIIGSSSRSTRSGSAPAAMNESVEVDRWAILAGIKK